jgi:hypothetical protein
MLNVVCLKHGTKYGPDYVNKLYNMIERNLTIPHRFICFTDDTAGLDSRIEIIKLPSLGIQGWWWKPYIFKEDHFSKEDTMLFFDLDMIIVKNIDHFMSYKPGSFVGLQDVGRVFRPGLKKLGSAVMRWPAGKFSYIWTRLESNISQTKKYQGDQDWIFEQMKSEIEFFPESWIRSYKWEIRNRSEILGFGPRAVFKDVRSPTIPDETSVLAFHGHPHVHTVQDPVIVDNWR